MRPLLFGLPGWAPSWYGHTHISIAGRMRGGRQEPPGRSCPLPVCVSAHPPLNAKGLNFPLSLDRACLPRGTRQCPQGGLEVLAQTTACGEISWTGP